jgi:hypothetical protein
MPIYRILLACSGVRAEDADAGARDIKKEFVCRPWRQNVLCEWDGSRLMLYAENDFDSNGCALLDEFSDAISACIKECFDGDVEIVSVAPFNR